MTIAERLASLIEQKLWDEIHVLDPAVLGDLITGVTKIPEVTPDVPRIARDLAQDIAAQLLATPSRPRPTRAQSASKARLTAELAEITAQRDRAYRAGAEAVQVLIQAAEDHELSVPGAQILSILTKAVGWPSA